MQNKMVVNVLVRYQRALKYVIVKNMRSLYQLLELNLRISRNSIYNYFSTTRCIIKISGDFKRYSLNMSR